MASTSFTNPGTDADDSSIGTVAWASTSNALTSDDNRATASLNNAISHYLKLTNYGFAIPSGATIDGIIVRLEGTTQGLTHHESIRLVKGGTIVGNNNATGSFSTSETTTDFGTSSDLWGESWTDTDINASNFGVVIAEHNSGTKAAIASVDVAQIQVYYTESGTPSTITQTVHWW